MQYYKINQTKVIYEVLNNEIIAINFSSGDYYALQQSAKQIWQLLEIGASVSNIVQSLAKFYQCEEDTIKADIHQFIKQISEEELIIPCENATDCQLQELFGSTTQSISYEPPTLHKYSDVQNLLKIDPIHDVDNSGWPNKPKEMVD